MNACSTGRVRFAEAQKEKTPGQVTLTGVLCKCLTMSYFHMGTPTLSSALSSFTSEFGMESGGTYTLCSSGKLVVRLRFGIAKAKPRQIVNSVFDVVRQTSSCVCHALTRTCVLPFLELFRANAHTT